jgi:hypothetical protein
MTLSRSRSSDNHAYKHTIHTVCMCVCVCVCVFMLFDCFPDSCLPNSLFLLDSGDFIWTTTSCRPCHPTFLPGFHRFSECACFSWLLTENCTLKASGYTDVHVQTSRRRCDGVFSPPKIKNTHVNTDVIYRSRYRYRYRYRTCSIFSKCHSY